jgi:hypothetical protein
MALFDSQTTSSLADLISKINTFLMGTGAGDPKWGQAGTPDRHVPGSGEWAVSQDDGLGESCEVAFQWDTGTPSSLGIYNYHTGLGAGNYNSGSGTVPFDQDGDSGNGAASTSNASLAAARSVPITNTPVQYWCFVGDVDVDDVYVHIVVEDTADTYVHFGWGILEKFNDWTGGQYAYGYRFQGGAASSVAIQTRSTTLLDGISTDGSGFDSELWNATIQVEDIPASPANGLWAVHLANIAGGTGGNNWLLGQDRQAAPVDRIQCVGGFRAGQFAKMLGQFRGTVTQGLISAYPIVTVNSDRNDTDTFYMLGQMKGVRGISLANFSSQDTVDIAGDTWHIFPTRTKGESGSLTNTTGWQGIMYKEN